MMKAAERTFAWIAWSIQLEANAAAQGIATLQEAKNEQARFERIGVVRDSRVENAIALLSDLRRGF